jgi:hypothetical protein
MNNEPMTDWERYIIEATGKTPAELWHERKKRERAARLKKLRIAGVILVAVVAFVGFRLATYEPISQGAVCHDGWVSRATGQGACSSHDGVKRWIYDGKEICNREDLTAQRLGELLKDFKVAPDHLDCTRNGFVLGMHGDG